LLGRGEAHHPLDAGAVVPGAIEEHDFAAGGQVGDMALGDALDDPTLTGRIAALEDHRHLGAGAPHPVLQFDQLPLQPQQRLELGRPVEGRWVLVLVDPAQLHRQRRARPRQYGGLQK